MLKKILAAVFCALTVLCISAYAADFKAGDTAYVNKYNLPVTEKPYAGGSKLIIYPGTKVTILEAYVNGDGKKEDSFHKIQLSDGTVGYIMAYVSRVATLDTAEVGEKKIEEASKTSDPEKYQHGINMNLLSDYIYGGRLAQSGRDCDLNKSLPKEWRMHERPDSLPLVGKAVIHVGDEGKLASVRATFYPGDAPQNYHERRLAELKAIGYDPVVPQPKGNPNTAFYCMSTTEFDVVAYNEKYVAVWSLGGVDISRGMGAVCMASSGIQYASWKSGVYFIQRQYCYLLDINNQISYVPEAQAMGKATSTLLVKTTPDSDDYVKSGVYKVNQSFQIVNATPQNGHYQIYYKKGLYYVEAKYVNAQLSSVKKPSIAYIAKVNTGGSGMAQILNSAGGAAVAEAKTGTSIDVIEKDAGSGYSKIWFNTKECYIKTEYLDEFQSTPTASGLAQLGAPIGTLSVDSPWSAYGEKTYSAEGLAIVKSENYGFPYDSNMKRRLDATLNAVEEMNDQEWVNVYKIENFTFDADPDFDDINDITTGEIYTVVRNGEIRYIVHIGDYRQSFTYYPGNAYSKKTTANTQPIYVETKKYNALAYNINDNNYFKLRDIAKMLDGTIKCFDVEYDASTNTIGMLSFFPYTAAGGELAAGDGAERTAYSSTVFLTYDGVPIKATCYNIDGNNYFKLRDITDALDCRVEWDSRNQLIKVYTSLPAYADPSEPVG